MATVSAGPEPERIEPGSLVLNRASCALTLDEHRAVKDAATADGRTVSNWLRMAALAALRRRP